MSREAILAEILRPSQSISQQYYVWNVQTKEGKATTGIIVDEQPDSLMLKDAQGKVTTIRKTDIEERNRTVATSHNLIVWSELPEASVLPSGLYATETKLDRAVRTSGWAVSSQRCRARSGP